MHARKSALTLVAALALAGCASVRHDPAVSTWSAPPKSGLEWVRSQSGWEVPDATGLRLFKPAVSGGTGVRF